jgi:hypothetical protein
LSTHCRHRQPFPLPTACSRSKHSNPPHNFLISTTQIPNTTPTHGQNSRRGLSSTLTLPPGVSRACRPRLLPVSLFGFSLILAATVHVLDPIALFFPLAALSVASHQTAHHQIPRSRPRHVHLDDIDTYALRIPVPSSTSIARFDISLPKLRHLSPSRQSRSWLFSAHHTIVHGTYGSVSQISTSDRFLFSRD